MGAGVPDLRGAERRRHAAPARGDGGERCPPLRVRVELVGVRAGGGTGRRVVTDAAAQPVRRDQARGRVSRRCVRAAARTVHGRPALLLGLRPASAPGHGGTPVRRGAARPPPAPRPCAAPPPPPVQGAGSQARYSPYVDAVAAAPPAAMTADVAPGTVLNVAH